MDTLTIPAGGAVGEARLVKVDAQFELAPGQGSDTGHCEVLAQLVQVGGAATDSVSQQYVVDQSDPYGEEPGGLTAVFPATGSGSVTVQLVVNKSSSPDGCTSTKPVDDVQVFEPNLTAVAGR
ncbi:MAG: hypothetical protein M3Z46_13210 [Actinomycetota bacterium]|nr:hypothetical protein [Actinomycetota bacterium]